MNQFTFTVYLTPYWNNTPNTILALTYSTTSSYSYSANITGPGLPDAGVSFNGNAPGVVNTVIPASIYKKAQGMEYTIVISTNSPTLSGMPVNSVEMGVKQDGTPISYQGFLFTNDEGSDKDWNDCVINLGLFNNSTDQ
jgi:hypothetical protein